MAGPEYLWRLSRNLYRWNWRRAAQVVKGLNWLIHKALLPAEAEVGSGIILEHYALGVVIHPQVKLGDHCRIYHHVTFAAETWIGSPHRIIVEDEVTVGAHSIIVARANTSLVIGRRATIGAGSVVTKDVPAGEIWAGVPAKKIGETDQRLARIGYAKFNVAKEDIS